MDGPIHTHDPGSCAAAYTSILGWPIAVGHRFRPRGGCTCAGPGVCETPGAHPLPGPLLTRSAKQLSEALTASPGAALIAPTLLFDAIVLPKRYGMAAMVSLDRIAPVPCLMDAARATLFVLPSTARYAVTDGARPEVELRSGPNEWVALPPSRGVRWDTPPWHEQTLRPVSLLHGEDVRRQLEDAMRVVVPQGTNSMAALPR